ncbi:hypothetical protein FNV43_RR04046 [Rhamnella rubrinervis]|uniref:Uncharacterized protein n=1 Tax=Rhamnella rubrinervis TaxID=2594499 RepID=A0A8K0MP78_9ROSA|nr:hypothetical protein FNV43_RR04046 [Rhamnella rubrinervis]
MGLCFIFLWSVFSSSSTSLTVQRESFDDIGEPASRNTKGETEENNGSEESEDEDSQKEKEDCEEEGLVVDGTEQALDREGKVIEDTKEEGVLVAKVDRDSVETLENKGGESRGSWGKRRLQRSGENSS